MSNKYNFKGNSIYDSDNEKIKIFHFAVVESTNDPFDGSRIRARIKGIDDARTTTGLPFAFPMLQKFFHAVPRVGETVMIFTPDPKNTSVDRVYMGPIISQPQQLFNDPELYTSRALMDSGHKNPAPAPSSVPENKGAFPNKKEIGIQGRKNTDIIFKENEVRIRAGKFVTTGNGEIPNFNKENPAYIQLKHDVTIKKEDGKDDQIGSVANVVASKINLLTHKDGAPRFKLTDQDTLIPDDELLSILDDAHQLVFGDKLVEYLKLQRAAFSNHVHRYHGKKPEDLAGSEDIDAYLDYDLDSMLSKNVRTN